MCKNQETTETIESNVDIDFDNKKTDKNDLSNSFESIINKEDNQVENQQDPKIYRQYHDFKNKFVKQNESHKASTEQKKISTEMKNETYRRALEQEEAEDDKLTSRDQNFDNKKTTKFIEMPTSSVSSSFKNGTQNINLKDW